MNGLLVVASGNCMRYVTKLLGSISVVKFVQQEALGKIILHLFDVVKPSK